MNINKRSYRKYAAARAKRSPVVRDCAMAFVVGGAICTFGEWVYRVYLSVGIGEDIVRLLVPCTLILLSAAATALGVFDRLAKYAGAGTLVPITGFANAVVSPAIDNKAEGLVTGVGAKIFIVAGPVIMYGTIASVVCGLIMYLIGAVFGL